MRSLGWLKFRYICKHRLLCITHKAIHLECPEYIYNIYLLNHTYNNIGYKWTPQEVIDLYML